jgi:hypothetical protein
MRAHLQRAALLILLLATRASGADAEFVIQISVDGLRGDLLAQALRQDSSGRLRHFRRFVDEGACTFNARADFTHTITLPNHTCMLTGRPVSRPAGQPSTVSHGYVSNGEPGPDETLHNHGNPAVHYFASVFDVVHDAGLSTALYASKSKFVLYDRSYDAAHGAPDTIPPDQGTDKIDRYVSSWAGVPPNASSLQEILLADLRTKPYNYCFIHYLDPDAAGHAKGWGSPAWQEALRRVDGDLGELLDLIDTQPRLAGRTTLLVTADHGGRGKDHSIPSLAADYTIPFLAWGAGVERGADLYALNRGRRADPGTTRPDYDAVPQPIRNGDAANVGLMLLGLEPVPGSTIDARQDLVLHETMAGSRRP